MSKRGGARKGAGRKPSPKGEIKIPITTWHKRKDVKLWGGKEKTKQKIYDALVLAVSPL